MAPVNDQARKHNQSLPGLGGIFNLVNFHTYHYAGNNPVVLTDPDGKFILNPYVFYNRFFQNDAKWKDIPLGNVSDSPYTIGGEGCVLTAGTRTINIIINYVYRGRLESGLVRYLPDEFNVIAELTVRNGFISGGIKSYLKKWGIDVTITRYSKENVEKGLAFINKATSAYAAYVKIKDGNHTINLVSIEGDSFIGFETYKDGKRGELVTMKKSDIHELIAIKINGPVFE